MIQRYEQFSSAISGIYHAIQKLERDEMVKCGLKGPYAQYLVAMVDTLEYLHKGGRLSKTAVIAGGLLNIKPILAIRNGQISVLDKARGSKQGYAQLNREIAKAGGADPDMPLLLGYTGAQDMLLNKYMEESNGLWSDAVPRTIIGSVIGTHAGPGAVAAAFFKKQ